MTDLSEAERQILFTLIQLEHYPTGQEEGITIS